MYVFPLSLRRETTFYYDVGDSSATFVASTDAVQHDPWERLMVGSISEVESGVYVQERIDLASDVMHVLVGLEDQMNYALAEASLMRDFVLAAIQGEGEKQQGCIWLASIVGHRMAHDEMCSVALAIKSPRILAS